MNLRFVFCFLFLFALSAPDAQARKIHVVYEGQRLGSIAKRYNVTVDELCSANGIKRNAPIRPGQRLVIPEKGKPSSPPSPPASPGPVQGATKAREEIPGPPRLHIVQKGHTLTAISQRYGVPIAAICRASGLNQKEPLDVGQIVVIPDKSDRDGNHARQMRLSGQLDSEKSSDGKSTHRYRPYLKKPWRRGYLSLYRYQLEWKGYVIGPKGEILPLASAKINSVMGGGGDGPDIDARLIRLLAHVSDAFGGRKIRIVSGYRTQSWVLDSKHKYGRALDFSIPGVPNEALRDYLRTLPNVGVGYYPNSSFVHLDVREGSAYWVDYAGPGEPPRKHP